MNTLVKTKQDNPTDWQIILTQDIDVQSLKGRYFRYGHKNVLYPERVIYEYCQVLTFLNDDLMYCQDHSVFTHKAYRHVSFEKIKHKIELFKDYQEMRTSHDNWLCAKT